MLAKCLKILIDQTLQHFEDAKHLARATADAVKAIPEFVQSILSGFFGVGPKPSQVAVTVVRTSPYSRLGEVLPDRSVAPFTSAASSFAPVPIDAEPKDLYGPCLTESVPSDALEVRAPGMAFARLTMKGGRAVSAALWRLQPGKNIPIVNALRQLAAGPVTPELPRGGSRRADCTNAGDAAVRIDRPRHGDASVWFQYGSLIQAYAVAADMFLTVYAVNEPDPKGSLDRALPAIYRRVDDLLGTLLADAGPVTGGPGPKSQGNPLAGVNLARAVRINCSQAIGPAQADARAYGDLNGDGIGDAVVAAACTASTSSWPDQVEVFDGASPNPARPRRLATLLDYGDGTDDRGLRVQDIRIRGATVTVTSTAYVPADPNAAPSRRVVDTFTWDGHGFGPRQRVVTRA